MTVKLGAYSFKFSSGHFEVIVTCTFLRLCWRYHGNQVLTVMFFAFFLLQNVFDLFFFYLLNRIMYFLKIYYNC